MLNLFALQGRFVKDPELRENSNGKKYCPFKLAWSESRNEFEEKLFIHCMVWGRQAEALCRFFSKGDQILVRGKLVQDEWKDDEGNRHFTIKLKVDGWDFCGSLKAGNEGRTDAPSSYGSDAGLDVSAEDFQDIKIGDGDLPF